MMADHEGNHEAFLAMCCKGDTENMRLALATGRVDVHATDNTGQTALILAARYGQMAALDILLQQPGVDLHATNNRGWTALMSAADNGEYDALEILLQQARVDPNQTDLQGNTPIQHLLGKQQSNASQRCLQLLVNDDRVDLDLKDGEGQSLEELAR